MRYDVSLFFLGSCLISSIYFMMFSHFISLFYYFKAAFHSSLQHHNSLTSWHSSHYNITFSPQFITLTDLTTIPSPLNETQLPISSTSHSITSLANLHHLTITIHYNRLQHFLLHTIATHSHYWNPLSLSINTFLFHHDYL